MDKNLSCVQAEEMPPILPGDIIAVYSAHQSAWGKPAQTYCVRRVEADGTPVSDMDFRHFLSNVVSISRKEGDDYVCIWRKENYEVAPWGHAYLRVFAEQMPEEAKENIADSFRECNKIWAKFCRENEETVNTILAASLALGVIKMTANVVKGGAT